MPRAPIPDDEWWVRAIATARAPQNTAVRPELGRVDVAPYEPYTGIGSPTRWTTNVTVDPGDGLLRNAGQRETMTNPVESLTLPVGKYLNKNGFQHDKTEALVAVELENETMEAFDFPSIRGWKHHAEGSLRHYGFELVQNRPLLIPSTKRAVENALAAMKEASPGPMLNSIRTSVHVHFDVTSYLFLDLLVWCLVYWTIEPYISYFCSETRRGNLFCLRHTDSQFAPLDLALAIKGMNPYSARSFTEDLRYASLNLASVRKFGSLEFRLKEGTDDPAEVATWIDILEKVRQFSLGFNNPLQFRDFFLRKCDAKDLPEIILGKELVSVINKRRGKQPLPPEKEIREAFVGLTKLFAAHKTFNFEEEVKAALEEQKAQAAALQKRLAEEEARHAARLETLRVERERMRQEIIWPLTQIGLLPEDEPTAVVTNNTDMNLIENTGDR